MKFEPEIEQLLQRFESTIEQGSVMYYDSEELETIIYCYIATEQFDKAHIALNYAHRLHPNATEIQCLEAKLALVEGNYEKAISILENITNIEADYIAILAECHLRMFNFEKAKTLFSQYLTICNTKELDLIFVDIASLDNSHNQPEIALEFIENAIVLFPNNTNIITEKAFALEQLDRLDDAADLFTQVLNTNPYQAEIWGILGSILFRQEKFNEALAAYDYTMAINPSDVYTQLQRAHCFFNLGEYENAIEPYEEYVKQNPDDWLVITFLAETYEHINKLEIAIEKYEDALKINDQMLETWVGLAACLHTLGNIDKAYHIIYEANKKFPEHQSVIYSMWQIESDLATTNNDNEMMKNALSHLLYCHKKDPKNDIINYEIGNIWLHFGDFGLALKFYEQAYNINPHIEKLTLAMAITYYGLGLYKEAKQYLNITRENIANTDEMFLSIFPDSKSFINEK